MEGDARETDLRAGIKDEPRKPRRRATGEDGHRDNAPRDHLIKKRRTERDEVEKDKRRVVKIKRKARERRRRRKIKEGKERRKKMEESGDQEDSTRQKKMKRPSGGK